MDALYALEQKGEVPDGEVEVAFADAPFNSDSEGSDDFASMRAEVVHAYDAFILLLVRDDLLRVLLHIRTLM